MSKLVWLASLFLCVYAYIAILLKLNIAFIRLFPVELKGDIPTRQYIQYLNELKPVDKKFILEQGDLDSTHLFVKKSARQEIERKVEKWMDEV